MEWMEELSEVEVKESQIFIYCNNGKQKIFQVDILKSYSKDILFGDTVLSYIRYQYKDESVCIQCLG